MIVDALDAQAETRDAKLTNGSELFLRQRAGLALESNFLGVGPGGRGRHAPDQPLQLVGRQKRRRPATEVDEVEHAVRNRRMLCVELPLAGDRVDVLTDVL